MYDLNTWPERAPEWWDKGQLCLVPDLSVETKFPK